MTASATTVSATASARSALERNRAALASMVRDVENAAAILPRHASTGWSGPAAWAFHCAVGRLHSEIVQAVSTLHASEELTVAALREVDA